MSREHIIKMKDGLAAVKFNEPASTLEVKYSFQEIGFREGGTDDLLTVRDWPDRFEVAPLVALGSRVIRKRGEYVSVLPVRGGDSDRVLTVMDEGGKWPASTWFVCKKSSAVGEQSSE